MLDVVYEGEKRTGSVRLCDAENDREQDALTLLQHLFRDIGAGDGDEVELTVRPTGVRPFGNRKIQRHIGGGYPISVRESDALAEKIP